MATRLRDAFCFFRFGIFTKTLVFLPKLWYFYQNFGIFTKNGKVMHKLYTMRATEIDFDQHLDRIAAMRGNAICIDDTASIRYCIEAIITLMEAAPTANTLILIEEHPTQPKRTERKLKQIVREVEGNAKAQGVYNFHALILERDLYIASKEILVQSKQEEEIQNAD